MWDKPFDQDGKIHGRPIGSQDFRFDERYRRQQYKKPSVQIGTKRSQQLTGNRLWIYKSVVRKRGLSRITINCDSTECTVYVHQAGAAKGYNPKNRGKLSYHPLLCFLSEMKIVLNSGSPAKPCVSHIDIVWSQ